ncbi:transcriptional repressor [Rhodococcus sp. SRB_17]|jgi:Fur family transcriptional regulator, stress-responsive regulator|uniref:Fur family transcriptional regulator n=1 Tax=unclassified Rhodococcus (in: high G+C Gram-positive bacteria) TaxID=192944 RepID=UPI000B93F407|nr:MULTISPECIES: Fur family transcriptional regulator [unclassified Rhodococcus (in: high G+C Gram-positive bacteria)]MCJ0906491.1 transcriptional repressor [Rhodococcus sp. ARC_M6]MDI9919257.1 Fur family transcriptional regulator [Rhodococcus sp. IEGM 1379]NMM83655.1 transcriptional repressor [Rhodococcus sp. SRB_17]OYD67747.1 Fur family ferric uptake transcriptional regulator [Rhodococcus sp. OK302]
MQDDGQDFDPRAQLRAAGLRVTAPRLAVLNAVTAQPHSDADTVAAQVREQLGSVSTQAVYDVLKACVSAGLLRRIEPAGSPARFETRTGDNHHHLVCRSCGKVVDVDCVVGQAPCLEPSDYHGFEIDEAEVVFWGRCKDCLTISTESTPELGAVSQNQDADRALKHTAR